MSATTVPGNPAGGSGGARRTGLVLLTGAGAGFLSGLFGVGGGLVIVPALMTVLGMSQRRAAATSLAAIVLTAAVGSVSYGARGEVSLLAAGLLVVGALVGAQAGVLALRRLPEWTLPWIFIGFAVLVVVSMRLRAPVREAALVLDGPRAAALIVVGVVAGILSGLSAWAGGASSCPASSFSSAWRPPGPGHLTARHDPDRRHRDMGQSQARRRGPEARPGRRARRRPRRPGRSRCGRSYQSGDRHSPVRPVPPGRRRQHAAQGARASARTGSGDRARARMTPNGSGERWTALDGAERGRTTLAEDRLTTGLRKVRVGLVER